ncbi:MAG: ABC transporter substrate-binding protein [Gammaproteobacteria bacterium]|nr:ABC transporter substrate-binding protein [Gammaproteobacteria bacterium]
MFFNHRKTQLLTGLILLLLLGGFASVAFAARNNTLIYGETSRPDTLDPYTSREMSSLRLSELLFNGLVGINESQEIVPELAESWSIAQDKKTYTFKLRQNVFWHGAAREKFTAKDVVFTINLIKHPKTQSARKSLFDKFVDVKALDDYTVQFTLEKPSLNALSLFSFKILPEHALKRHKYLSKLNRFVNRPIGTGPYQFKSSNSNREITLVANDNYFLGKPKIAKIIMKPYSDKNIMNQALTFNSLDMVVEVDPQHITELQADSRFSLIGYNTLSYSFFAYNNNNPDLANRDVRRALSQAINREEMLRAFYNNNGTIISGPFAPGSWAYNLDVIPLGYNPLKAIATLKQAGYIQTRNGFVDRKGRPLSFKMLVPISKNNETNKRVILAYKNFLNKIGVQVQVNFVEKESWKKRVFANHDFDITYGTWAFDDAADISDIFHSAYNKPWQNNFISYHNPQVDKLIEQNQATTDHQVRRTINYNLHKLIADDSPYTFLWSLTQFSGYSNKLKNVDIHPYKFFENVHLWEFK